MSFAPTHTTVWIEIPVSDLSAAVAFYGTVTGLTLNREQMGPNETAIFQAAEFATGVAGHLYEGKPAGDGTGPTVHLAAEGTLEEAMDRVTAAGGKVISPAIEIPAGRFFYATDPDGNSIGLFEAA
ncbi:VOC family protein [Nioella sp. MMSF_3534]|uniref:VOC family protein n=1 Tax=Nioella sp. MMSF_3534 TaxID=3046720 RepID=UPI00273D1913|nr:VOC family protein [Nioella sp. MMSF_3534]